MNPHYFRDLGSGSAQNFAVVSGRPTPCLRLMPMGMYPALI